VPRTCLLVDDSEDFLDSATQLLTLEGMQVVGQAFCGAEGLRLSAALRPDIVLVDVELGTEDGLEVAAELVKAGTAGHVILISLRDRYELSAPGPDGVGLAFMRKDTLGARAIENLIAGDEHCDLSTRSPALGGGMSDIAEFIRLQAVLRDSARLMLDDDASPESMQALVGVAAALVGLDGATCILPGDHHGDSDSAVANEDPTDCSVDGVPITAPIVVGGATWGTLRVSSVTAESPAVALTRLTDAAQLTAEAITYAQAEAELHVLTASQSAMRRIGAIVAQGAEPQSVFVAVGAEAAQILGVKAVSVIRYHPETATLTKLYGTHGRRSAVPDGTTWPLAECPEGVIAVETGGPSRVDDWTVIPGPRAAAHLALGYGQAVAAPIMVDGTIWGLLGAYGEADETLPLNCEQHLADIATLMVTAISNAQARGLAESQGALRRVATVVAQGAEPQAVFTSIAVEAAHMLKVGAVSLIRYDAETQMLTKIYGTHGQRSPVQDGATWPLAECPEGIIAIETCGPARVDDWTVIPGPTAAAHRDQGFGTAVAAPIMVDGAIWGLLAAYGEAAEVLPSDSEQNLADFTQLIATAIANAQVRDELRALAERQGEALRRVATLVAQQASSNTIFNAVADEASRALDVDRVEVGRCHDDGSVTLLGSTARPGRPSGSDFSASGHEAVKLVMASGRTARMDDWSTLSGPVAQAVRREGYTSVVSAPIRVDGSLWGTIVVLNADELPRDAETRLTDFTHLVASSISNVHARDNLVASRARVVSASDDTRRRIERNLHDGVQQRMVALAFSLRALRTRFSLPPEAQCGLDEIARGLDGVLEEVRIFSQGLHPALLSRSGLNPALRELARRSPIVVELDVCAQRFTEPIETAVYYVVSEALSNAAKHSHASAVSVVVNADDATVRARVADDGTGGAVLDLGSGLIGLIDRVEALGGSLTLDSPPGDGTTIAIELPASPPTPPAHMLASVRTANKHPALPNIAP
jgi:signal transduction histidine kinase/CheY-like chemotaxis protein